MLSGYSEINWFELLSCLSDLQSKMRKNLEFSQLNV